VATQTQQTYSDQVRCMYGLEVKQHLGLVLCSDCYLWASLCKMMQHKHTSERLAMIRVELARDCEYAAVRTLEELRS